MCNPRCPLYDWGDLVERTPDQDGFATHQMGSLDEVFYCLVPQFPHPENGERQTNVEIRSEASSWHKDDFKLKTFESQQVQKKAASKPP